MECFEGVSWTGQVVPIVPGGRSIPLSFHSRQQYVDQAVAFRLHEMDLQVTVTLAELGDQFITSAISGLKLIRKEYEGMVALRTRCDFRKRDLSPVFRLQGHTQTIRHLANRNQTISILRGLTNCSIYHDP